VCGRDNAAGLRASFTMDPVAGEVKAEVVLPEHFHGYPGIAHGGILTALLDEAAVRTALLHGDFDDLMVTAKMELVFKRPTPTGKPVTVVARIVKRTASRALAAAEIRLADGTVTSRAEVLLTRPPAEVAAAWAVERPHWRVDET
jgi:uncharacterized protein (TIGR00369 family)